MQGLDQTIELRIPLYIVGIPLLVAGIATVCAFLAHRAGRKKLFYQCLFVALVAGLLFAPSMYLDVVTLSPQRIEQRMGFVFFRRSKGFTYNDVASVHITETRGWRGRHEVIWQVHWRNGTITDLNPGDLWEWNTDTIIPYLKSRGVTFN